MTVKYTAAVVLLLLSVTGMAIWFKVARPPAAADERDTTSQALVTPQPDESMSTPPTQAGSLPAPGSPVDGATAVAAIQELLRPRVVSEAELIARLADPNLDLRIRCEAGRMLARLGSASALAAVKQALITGSPSLRTAIAEGLGESPLPEARLLLTTLVSDADESVAQGAVRGWALAGGAEAAHVLTTLVYSDDRPESVRTAAALALGDLVNQPQAFAALTNAAWQLRDDALAPAVLEGLGRRPIGEIQEFFRQYLATPDLPGSLRSAAVEALGHAEGDSSPLLLEFLRDADPEVRASAAWALSTTLESGRAGELLVTHLRAEPDPAVRCRLYQALGNQEPFDPTAVIPLVQQETRTDVRLSGLDFLGQACRDNPSPTVVEFFDTVAIPELKTIALQSEDAHSRMAAVIALRRAPTPGATAALADIAILSTDPKVAEAADTSPPVKTP
jgi:HEAT repeat protein